MVYMVIYQAHDGLWYVWDSPLAEWQLEWAAGECLRANGADTPIRAIWATDSDMLGVVLKQLNAETTINLPGAQECPVTPYEGLLPPPRPYHQLSRHDQRRLDIENGPGGDVEKPGPFPTMGAPERRERFPYHPTDADLTAWSRLLGRYARGELES
jgi:hypothetical protein